jgi:hypothetical protein
MTEPLERLDAIELAITQLADAVELLAGAVASGRPLQHLDDVLRQTAAVRTFLGTNG